MGNKCDITSNALAFGEHMILRTGPCDLFRQMFFVCFFSKLDLLLTSSSVVIKASPLFI